jgi:hypothetical protein
LEVIWSIRIARDLKRDSQERELQEQLHDEADNTDADKEDRQNDHECELDADEDDEKDHDGIVGDDDNNVEDEADNMRIELLNFPVFPRMAHCLYSWW